MKLIKKLQNANKRKHVSVNDFTFPTEGWELAKEESNLKQWTRDGAFCSITFYPVPAHFPFNLDDASSVRAYYEEKCAQSNLLLPFLEVGYIGHVRALATVFQEAEGEGRMMGTYTFYFMGFSFIFKWEKKANEGEKVEEFIADFKALEKGFAFSDLLRSFHSV